MQKGSFAYEGKHYNIEPYHKAIHKRSLQPKEGMNHVITDKEAGAKPQTTDFKCKWIIDSDR